MNKPFETRLLSPDTDRNMMLQGLRLLTMEFVSDIERRDSWLNRMSEVMSYGYDEVAVGRSDRGGAVFVGLQGDDVLSVFTLKFYQRNLIKGQQYFVIDNTGQHVAVSTFGDIADTLCGQDDGAVVSEYDLGFVKPPFRDLNLFQNASKLAHRYVLEKHQGKGVSFTLVRSSIAGQNSPLGRNLRDYIIKTVGIISSDSYRLHAFDQYNSIAMSDAVRIIEDAKVFTTHESSGAAAHMAKKLGGIDVGYAVSNFSKLIMTCHRS